MRIVADVGNSRIKWGRLASDGSLAATIALPRDDPDAWSRALAAWGLGESAEPAWTIASVNPPVAERLIAWLSQTRGITRVRVIPTAVEVPVPHALATPRTTGADRALTVLAALGRHPEAGPGQVVSCGTAVTVERIGADGVWQGGAIAPGLGAVARALNESTAQLPRVTVGGSPPLPWGDATESALAAGIFWSVVGALRELTAAPVRGLGTPPLADLDRRRCPDPRPPGGRRQRSNRPRPRPRRAGSVGVHCAGPFSARCSGGRGSRRAAQPDVSAGASPSQCGCLVKPVNAPGSPREAPNLRPGTIRYDNRTP